MSRLAAAIRVRGRKQGRPLRPFLTAVLPRAVGRGLGADTRDGRAWARSGHLRRAGRADRGSAESRSDRHRDRSSAVRAGRSAAPVAARSSRPSARAICRRSRLSSRSIRRTVRSSTTSTRQVPHSPQQTSHSSKASSTSRRSIVRTARERQTGQLSRRLAKRRANTSRASRLSARLTTGRAGVPGDAPTSCVVGAARARARRVRWGDAHPTDEGRQAPLSRRLRCGTVGRA